MSEGTKFGLFIAAVFATIALGLTLVATSADYQNHTHVDDCIAYVYENNRIFGPDTRDEGLYCKVNR